MNAPHGYFIGGSPRMTYPHPCASSRNNRTASSVQIADFLAAAIILHSEAVVSRTTLPVIRIDRDGPLGFGDESPKRKAKRSSALRFALELLWRDLDSLAISRPVQH